MTRPIQDTLKQSTHARCPALTFVLFYSCREPQGIRQFFKELNSVLVCSNFDAFKNDISDFLSLLANHFALNGTLQRSVDFFR